MPENIVEHINMTVSDPGTTAKLLCRLFSWKVRWSGQARDEGETVHVGSDTSYLALYSHRGVSDNPAHSHKTVANLNHVGILVPDLDSIEARVKAEGIEPYGHEDYEPGRRFYFRIADDIEIEAVSYAG